MSYCCPKMMQQLDMPILSTLKHIVTQSTIHRTTSFNSLRSKMIVILLLLIISLCNTGASVPLSSGVSNEAQQSDLDNHIHADQINSLQTNDATSGYLQYIHPTNNNNNNNSSQHHTSQNSISSAGGKKGSSSSSSMYHQNLIKLQRHLNERQQELIKRNPGSLVAVARALKMAIVECQHQTRHEHWDCPIYGFSMEPSDIFGRMMARSFKETSFIHSLLSSAIAHSIARACTESIMSTCSRKQTRDGGYKEDIEFGCLFSRQFMDATHELQASSSIASNIDRNLNNNNNIIIANGNGSSGSESAAEATAAAAATTTTTTAATSGIMEPNRRERKIRNMINAHNDEVGRLLVLNGMRRECKCHGLSGACTMQTCWLKLPSFREVAGKLHDSLDQAIRVIYMAQNPTNRQKSLTSATVKKLNKKRSSVVAPAPVNGLLGSSTSTSTPSSQTLSSKATNYFHSQDPYVAPSGNTALISDTASIIGSRRSGRGAKRHTIPDQQAQDLDNSYRHAPVAAGNSNSDSGGGGGGIAQSAQESPTDDHSLSRDSFNSPSQPNNTTQLKRRPVARSIGIHAHTISPSKFDLLYYEESPDFCIPSERYNIKGTKGRTCSENPNATNHCDKLCCGRGYKTEVREEKYKCECQFKFCCKLDCNTCTRRKVIHKCL